MLRNSLYVAVLLLLTGCPEEIPEDDMEVIIENQTIEKIVIWASLSESEENPDTTLPIDFPWGDIESIYEENIIESNSTGSNEYNTNSLKHILEKGWLHYHILNYDTIITVPWERIRDEYIVAKRVDFDTWEDLELVEFTVTYP